MNGEDVFKGELSSSDSAAASERTLLAAVMDEQPRVRDHVAGQQVLKTHLLKTNYKITLSIYTLNEQDLKLKKKTDKVKRAANKRKKNVSKENTVMNKTSKELL